MDSQTDRDYFDFFYCVCLDLNPLDIFIFFMNGFSCLKFNLGGKAGVNSWVRNLVQDRIS